MKDINYFKACTDEIKIIRDEVSSDLKAIGFTVLESKANFIFASSEKISGFDLYQNLKSRGILVRWFDAPRLRNFVRITIGNRDQMGKLLVNIREILE